MAKGMGPDDFPETLALLESYGQSTVLEMREKLEQPRQRRTGGGRLRSLRTNAVATGNLVRSIHFKVEWSGKAYGIEFEMADYGVYVDGGRRPGGFPPLERIREWCRVKGIPVRAAYPIARRIAEEGIAARPFFGSTVEAGLEDFLLRLSESVAADTQSWLDRRLGAR